MNVADKFVEILEEEGIEHVFGIPGEQIMPLYRALSASGIDHILTRHEQAAAHAADGYTRSSGKIGVCIATASPGALNFTMALATAFKDNVPILVITGDNELKYRNTDHFQTLPQVEIFKNITRASYNPLNGTEAMYVLRASIFELKNNPKGPIHINLSKDVLLEEEFKDFDLCYLCEDDLSNISKAQELIDSSKRPLLILGAGAISEKNTIETILDKFHIPVTTTFHAKGIISEENELNLGMVGIRQTPRAKYAFENADCIIALGLKASERTLPKIPNNLIHVNINRDVLVGDYPIHGKVSDFLAEINFRHTEWIGEILKIDDALEIEGLDKDRSPQAAIKRILERFPDNIVVSDAGSHTTWTTLLKKSLKPRQLLFSGGLAPMGYGLPAAIGASIATGEKVILINGDGDFQMNLQELATLRQNNLDVIVFILNNSEYGIIRQWQEQFYGMKPYQVKLENPDFIKLASSYSVDGVRIDNLQDLDYLLEKDLTGPLVVEIIVESEDIPLPE
ncbi:MAG: thiamine pyrophosphate-binding protein [Methanobrevibacter sp.]|uniref:thiamine pyrophosphate-binding protein n=1 Tax=Methanobrevibacter sp. TaxID=66852 RepID=UPI0025CBF9BE|nr:thiamine pyrophosphate-binding protein [Methanobrevibacter sp.]MBQ6100459.1 thiamine pyrophosphate-binding protein [Methanobrevibacter sp.]